MNEGSSGADRLEVAREREFVVGVESLIKVDDCELKLLVPGSRDAAVPGRPVLSSLKAPTSGVEGLTLMLSRERREKVFLSASKWGRMTLSR